jgi:hypothetical protein
MAVLRQLNCSNEEVAKGLRMSLPGSGPHLSASCSGPPRENALFIAVSYIVLSTVTR